MLAEQVAAHLNLFDEVLATDLNLNLKACSKRDALVQRFGDRGFDYVGNDWPDIAVWQSAERAHVVSQSDRLIASARNQGNLGHIFSDDKPPLTAALFKAMRPHQWIKNLLVFIPLLASHRYGDITSLVHALLAFLAFGLTASSVYLLNDLVDVTDDRHHVSKRNRPFAAGNLSLLIGWVIWPTLLVMAFALSGLTLPWKFCAALGIYFVTSLGYSLQFKQVPIVDVMTLAILYTLRIIAGATAIAVPKLTDFVPSFWYGRNGAGLTNFSCYPNLYMHYAICPC